MGALLTYAACDEGGVDNPLLHKVSEITIKIFSFPLGITATQLLRVSGYMLLFYLLDVFVYSWVLAFFVDRWMARK